MSRGYEIGADEVGYGCIAGPLVVCAFAAPLDWKSPEGLNDSKKLSAKKLLDIHKLLIADKVSCYRIVWTDPEDIDRYGVWDRLTFAYVEAIEAVKKQIRVRGNHPVSVINDGTIAIPGSKSIIKADSTIPTVMAASVLAKVIRDSHMIGLEDKHSGWGFSKHKGYPVPQHLKVLEERGVIKGLHRMSYEPCRSMITTEKRQKSG